MRVGDPRDKVLPVQDRQCGFGAIFEMHEIATDRVAVGNLEDKRAIVQDVNPRRLLIDRDLFNSSRRRGEKLVGLLVATCQPDDSPQIEVHAVERDQSHGQFFPEPVLGGFRILSSVDVVEQRLVVVVAQVHLASGRLRRPLGDPRLEQELVCLGVLLLIGQPVGRVADQTAELEWIDVPVLVNVARLGQCLDRLFTSSRQQQRLGACPPNGRILRINFYGQSGEPVQFQPTVFQGISRLGHAGFPGRRQRAWSPIPLLHDGVENPRQERATVLPVVRWAGWGQLVVGRPKGCKGHVGLSLAVQKKPLGEMCQDVVPIELQSGVHRFFHFGDTTDSLHHEST